MKALNFLWLWLLLLLCLTHGFEARSFHNRRYQNLRRISRSTATIQQRQMRSLTHTARCRRYIMYILSQVYFHLLPLCQGTFTPLSAGESCQKGVSLQTQRLGLWKGSKFYMAFHQEIYFEGKISQFVLMMKWNDVTHTQTKPFIAIDVFFCISVLNFNEFYFTRYFLHLNLKTYKLFFQCRLRGDSPARTFKLSTCLSQLWLLQNLSTTDEENPSLSIKISVSDKENPHQRQN